MTSSLKYVIDVAMEMKFNLLSHKELIELV